MIFVNIVALRTISAYFEMLLPTAFFVRIIGGENMWIHRSDLYFGGLLDPLESEVY